MQQNFNKYFSILGVIAVLMANATVSMAADDPIPADLIDLESFESALDEPVVVEEVAPQPTVEQEEFLKRLKQELNLTKTDYQQLLNNISDAKKRLEIVSEERIDLDAQLKNIAIHENLITERLVDVMMQVVSKENGIKGLYEEIEMREVALEYQKSLLQDYIKLMYQEENEILSVDKDGSVSTFKMLLSDGSVGENLRKLDYLDLLNEAGLQIADRLDEIFLKLEGQKKKLTEDKDLLDQLRFELVQQKNQLELQKQAKQQLLDITAGQEEVYAQLVEQEMEQQDELVGEIQNLRSVYLAADDKLKNDPANFDIADYNLDRKSQVVYDFQVQNSGKSGCSFDWPVQPDRGISTYFRNDGDGYYGRFGMIHSALDIPKWQGSPVYAPAEGVAYVAKDNGYGYSYIILSHACGFTTTYGHMSEILVEEGQYIEKGTIIGLSGGMPGTLGAGYMTTGPHLHFEMRLNDMYVDPLDHLPLEIFAEGELIDKYKEKWETAVLRSTLTMIER